MAQNERMERGGAVEDPAKDIGTKKPDLVRRWKMELEQAEKVERKWRNKTRTIIDKYRGEKTEHFNILFSNTATILPAVFNQVPQPDVRRRFPEDDKIGKEISQGLEKVLSWVLDQHDFMDEVKATILDYLLGGRGFARVRHDPKVQGEEGEEELVSQDLFVEMVPWDRYRVCPARTWQDVRWVAYQHFLTKQQLKDAFTGSCAVDEIPLDKAVSQDGSHGDDNADKETEDILKRAEVWEIWCKDDRKVYWICPTYQDECLKVQDDPLGLKDFFDCPRPIYSIPTPDSLVPIPEYTAYEQQAEELNSISRRIRKLTDALKARGVYDSRIKELGRVFDDAEDNELIPSESVNVALSAAKSGNLDSLVWFAPIDVIIGVLQQLYQNRNEIKATIYEITGISDIVRGQSDPRETLGAQQIKAQFGTLRIDDRRREVSRFCRDIVRIMAEIVAEHFQPETISMIVGDMVQPEHLAVLRDDFQRSIKIDIETDSTVAAELAEDKSEVTELLTGITGYFQGMAAVTEPHGPVPLETAKAILLTALRRLKLGRTIEDAIEAIGKEGEEGGPQSPQQQQMKQQQEQMMQQQQQMMQMQVQAQQMKMQAETQKAQMQLQKAQADLALFKEKLRGEMSREAARSQLDQIKTKAEAEGIFLKKEMGELEAQWAMLDAQRQEELAAAQHARDMEKIEAERELGEAKSNIERKNLQESPARTQ